jgi:hypothetical protein
MQALLQFLKKHYEKIILCVVLLSLAAAAVWMGSILKTLREEVSQPVTGSPNKSKPIAPLDLTADLQALDQITNPPPVVLSGPHNLFNPVTWRRKANGEWLKILKTGPDALSVVNITPLYTVISYDHPSGNGSGVYVFNIQWPSGKRAMEYPRKDEKPKSGLYIIKGVKGNPDDPSEIQLEIPTTQETVFVSKTTPFKRVDGYMADMRYDPELRNLTKLHINENVTLDGEQYKIVEITKDVVRVQSVKSTKVTTITWKRNP